MVFALLHSKFTHAETGLWFKHARTHTHTHTPKQTIILHSNYRLFRNTDFSVGVKGCYVITKICHRPFSHWAFQTVILTAQTIGANTRP